MVFLAKRSYSGSTGIESHVYPHTERTFVSNRCQWVRLNRSWLFFGAVAVILATTLLAHSGFSDESAQIPETLAALLPDVLCNAQGNRVDDIQQWNKTVRPSLLELFSREAYGRPLPAAPVLAVLVEESQVARGGGAIRRQYRMSVGQGATLREIDVLEYMPQAPSTPPGVFIGINFLGNQSVDPDPEILITRAWLNNTKDGLVVDHRATEASRGAKTNRWPVDTILKSGFGLVTFCYGDVHPDRPDGRAESVLVALGRPAGGELESDEPGAITAWAWGVSHLVDWLFTRKDVDLKRLAVVGHSRLGKTALLAGARDERLAMVVSNNSGSMGAALSKRPVGEDVAAITKNFPHWFAPQLARWAGREQEMPFDQHMLLALTAPRLIYVASAQEDAWADPEGEFLSLLAASPVWQRSGLGGLPASSMPPVDQPLWGRAMGYHIRTGSHDLLPYDWEKFLEFANKNMPTVTTQ